MLLIGLPETTNAYFTIAEGRATDATFAGLTDDEIANARAEVEDEIEGLTDVAFVPRTATATLNGTGKAILFLPHMYVRSITSVRVYSTPVTYTDFTADELADIPMPSETGAIRRSTLGYWTAGHQNIEIAYEHGMDAPPARVKRAALILFRYRVAGARWRIPSDTLAVDAEGNPTAEGLPATETSGRENEASATGIPVVDDLLSDWLSGIPVVA